MHFAVDQERFEKITALLHGSHPENEDGAMCVMEAVSWVTHKDWSDAPPCVCPVLSAFMRAWNDGLPNDEDRTRLLKPLIPKLINTKGSETLEQRRATMAADWLVRVHTPAWLRLAKLDKQADLLASLPEITDFANCPSLMPTLEAVRIDADAARDASWDAAKAAAWAASWAASWDASWAAARAASWAASWAAAWDAAWAAAWAASRDAARDAAWAAAKAASWDAARAALKPTQQELQRSALDLVERMIVATE